MTRYACSTIRKMSLYLHATFPLLTLLFTQHQQLLLLRLICIRLQIRSSTLADTLSPPNPQSNSSNTPYYYDNSIYTNSSLILTFTHLQTVPVAPDSFMSKSARLAPSLHTEKMLSHTSKSKHLCTPEMLSHLFINNSAHIYNLSLIHI